MIVIGSHALQLLGYDVTPTDVDILVNFKEWNEFYQSNSEDISEAIPLNGKVQAKFNDGFRIEVEFIGRHESDVWLSNHTGIMSEVYSPILKCMVCVPPLEILYLMKKSHVHCDSVHFDKTIKDYQHLSTMIDKVPDDYWSFFELRKSEAEKRYNHRTPSLNMSNDEFFDRSKNAVGYVFIHDTIHEAVKHFDVPVYEMIKRDFSLAKCESDMFHDLTFDVRIKCVQEEAYVIAIERYLLQDSGTSDIMTPWLAYKNAVQRICTTLCSGFFRQFAIDNYDEVMRQYDEDFIMRFTRGFNDKTIQMMDGVDSSRVDEAMTNFIENTN